MGRVLIIDDQISYAEGTASLLRESHHRTHVCAWLEDLAELEADHQVSRFDAALLDLVFARQQLNVLDALDILSGWRPRLPVIILTAGGESRRHFIEDALQYPCVRGGVPKSAPTAELFRCIANVLDGDEHYDHEIAAYRPASHRPPTEALLGRDARIWFALAKGVTSHEAIAARIGCQPKTVQNSVRRMGDKLIERGLAKTVKPTLRDLIHYAARHEEYFAVMEQRYLSAHPMENAHQDQW